MGICGFTLKQKYDNNIDYSKILEDMAYNLRYVKDITIPFKKDDTYLCYTSTCEATLTPICSQVLGYNYCITLNGRLFNYTEIVKHLTTLGYTLKSKQDSEAILTLYIHYKEKCLEYLDGEFSFAIFDEFEHAIFIARDRLGIKPMYYTNAKTAFLFASKISSLLTFPKIPRVISNEELCELIGLGPAHTPNKTYFKDIYELEAGHYGVFNITNNSFTNTCYWDLVKKDIDDSEDECIKNIKTMIDTSCLSEMTDNTVTMLSGGLDSTILTTIAKKKLDNITTYSISYPNNNNDFQSNSYQPSKDSDFITIANNKFQTNHINCEVLENELLDNLRLAMLARDMPGMADIDSALLVFLKKISKLEYENNSVVLSGECSDEIFRRLPLVLHGKFNCK